jgi:hypothetical protein
MFENLKKKAIKFGATEFGVSRNKNKKFYVIYNKKRINFGAKGYSDYTIHQDEERRKRYFARHSKIKNKEGKFVYKLKTSASFWSLNLLWM